MHETSVLCLFRGLPEDEFPAEASLLPVLASGISLHRFSCECECECIQNFTSGLPNSRSDFR